MKLNKMALMCGILGAFWLTGCTVTEPKPIEPEVSTGIEIEIETIDRSEEAATNVLTQLTGNYIKQGGNADDLKGSTAVCTASDGGDPKYDYSCVVSFPKLNIKSDVVCDVDQCIVTDIKHGL